ncbi:nucleoside hydrolase [Nesterenkonia flava]|uniref:Nucleoside hydrolase n=1 Tax=Nesterenkonia flava TaxID=469799 RepID=A0ABU1FVK4_9MICC|nr:nucleoside hydrolase [Nesterenkonia flava]MDR5712181.1 nucleoside hydrolase [Nesterenkonia flava]
MIPLFLDCDPGIDDAVALGYLFCRDDVNLVGLAASGGNVSTEQVVTNTLGWLALAGRAEIPVHPGADHALAGKSEYAEETHGDTGAGYARLPAEVPGASDVDAAHAWVRAARQHPGELIGVLTAPATNLALALRIEPELPRLLKRLFIMGGAFNYRGNTRPTTEWNVTYDPEAAKEVIDAFSTAEQLPVIAPLEATEAVEMTPARLAEVTASLCSPQWSAWLEELGAALRFYFEFHETDGHGYLAHIHDPYVTAAALHWGLAQCDGTLDQAERQRIPWAQTATTTVDVELAGTLTRGETVADWLGRWSRKPNAELIRSIDAEAFLSHLTDTLKKGPSPHGH